MRRPIALSLLLVLVNACSRGPSVRDLHAAYELEKSTLAKLEQERAEAESDFNTSKQYRQRMRENGLYTEDELARLEKEAQQKADEWRTIIDRQIEDQRQVTETAEQKMRDAMPK